MLGILRQSIYAEYNTSRKLLDGKPARIENPDDLIDIDTFHENQRILSGKRVPLVPNNSELYPLRKLLIYSKCGTPIRSSVQRSSSGKRSPRYPCATKGHRSDPIEEMHQLFVGLLE